MQKTIYFFPSLVVTISAVILPILTLASIGTAIQILIAFTRMQWPLLCMSIGIVVCNLICTVVIYIRPTSTALNNLRFFCLMYLGVLLAGIIFWWVTNSGSLNLPPPIQVMATPFIAITVAGMYFTRRYACLSPNHCLKCGYDLRGSDSPRCPECGKLRADDDAN